MTAASTTRVLFLAPNANDAYYQGRIRGLASAGVEVRVAAFERELYLGRPEWEPHVRLGALAHGRYFGRLRHLLRAAPRLDRELERADAVYAFNLDMLLLARLALRRLGRRLPLIYDVADVPEVLVGPGAVSAAARALERRLIRHVSVIVMTSNAYALEYFARYVGVRDLRYHLVENKVDPTMLPVVPPPRTVEDGTLRIGYFGVLRCQRSWDTLVRAAGEACGRIRVLVRGVPLGLERFDEARAGAPYVEYAGPYTAPHDLESLYGDVDMVWAAHRHRATNSMWARGHRFYEACFFRRPPFTQLGTQDGTIAAAFDLGPCIDLDDPDGAVAAVLGVRAAQIAHWRRNIERLPRAVYTYTDEYERLAAAILERTAGLELARPLIANG